MNANFGLVAPVDAAAGRVSKDRRKQLVIERAQADFDAWAAAL